jgi:hypothetical protein
MQSSLESLTGFPGLHSLEQVAETINPLADSPQSRTICTWAQDQGLA